MKLRKSRNVRSCVTFVAPIIKKFATQKKCKQYPSLTLPKLFYYDFLANGLDYYSIF